MKIKNLKKNVTEVETKKYLILVSYSTPVAYQDKKTGKFYRTDEKFSVTTSKHINQWLEGVRCLEVSQIQIEALLEG